MNPHIPAAFTQYVEHMRAANYSPNTIYARKRAIVRFRLAAGLDPLECDPQKMAAWWVGLSRLVPSSRAGELAAVRSYCKFALRHGFIETDPTILIDRPKLPRRVPRPIGEASLADALLTAPRDVRVILSLAAFCGARACEISALEWADVRNDVVLLRGKGNKERVVPLHPAAADALNRLPGNRRGRVLHRRDDDPGVVPPHRVSQWANQHLHDHGIAETLHQLRHRYGTIVWRISRDLRLTQDLLGHATPAMTALYTAWDQSQASVVIAQIPSPRPAGGATVTADIAS